MALINLRRVGKMMKESKARRRYTVKVSRLLFGRLFHLQIIKEENKWLKELDQNADSYWRQIQILFVFSVALSPAKFIVSWKRERLNNDIKEKCKQWDKLQFEWDIITYNLLTI